MSISHYIKEIGRGKDGARSLSREQATDLFGQVLDGAVTDLEVGGFCLAMRIKGETPDEMAGFLDATHARLQRTPDNGLTTVVLPSYNGARKLPVLTPLLALLLAREGAAVLVHGTATEDKRMSSEAVFAALGQPAWTAVEPLSAGQCAFVPTEVLHTGLKRLLDVRRAVGLRNPAHSLVKLMNPVRGPGASSSAAIRTPSTPRRWPRPGRSPAPTPCCCAAPKASRWPMRGERPSMEVFRDGQRHRSSRPHRTARWRQLPALPSRTSRRGAHRCLHPRRCSSGTPACAHAHCLAGGTHLARSLSPCHTRDKPRRRGQHTMNMPAAIITSESQLHPGTVALVGAGPGDPESAHASRPSRRLPRATVLLVDDLVSDERAGACPPRAHASCTWASEAAARARRKPSLKS